MRDRETGTWQTDVVRQVNRHEGRQSVVRETGRQTGRQTDRCSETGKQTGRQAECSERDRGTDRKADSCSGADKQTGRQAECSKSKTLRQVGRQEGKETVVRETSGQTGRLGDGGCERQTGR